MQTLQELTVLYRCYWFFFIFRGDPAFRPNRRSDRCSDGWCCLSGVPGKQICQQFVYTFILVSTHNRLTSVVSLHLLHLPLWKRADKSQAEETVVLADFWVFTSRHLLQLLGFVSHRVTLVGFLRHWALDCCSTGNHIILEASLLCLRQRWGVLPDSVFFFPYFSFRTTWLPTVRLCYYEQQMTNSESISALPCPTAHQQCRLHCSSGDWWNCSSGNVPKVGIKYFFRPPISSRILYHLAATSKSHSSDSLSFSRSLKPSLLVRMQEETWCKGVGGLRNSTSFFFLVSFWNIHKRRFSAWECVAVRDGRLQTPEAD